MAFRATDGPGRATDLPYGEEVCGRRLWLGVLFQVGIEELVQVGCHIGEVLWLGTYEFGRNASNTFAEKRNRVLWGILHPFSL